MTIKQKILLSLYLLLLFVLLALQCGLIIAKANFSISSVIYWMEWLGFVLLSIVFKAPSKVSLGIAIILTSMGAILDVLGLGIGETAIRLGFAGWLVGIAQTCGEIRSIKRKDNS